VTNPVLGYVVGSAVIGLLIGAFIGSIIRGARARRQAQRLTTEADALREQLNAARHQPGEAHATPPPQRWTGTEMAAVVAAAATFIGSIGAVYANYRGGQTKELQAQLLQSTQKHQESESKRAEIASNAKSVLGADLKRWFDLPEVTDIPSSKSNRINEFPVDNLKLRGTCNAKKLAMLYHSLGPAVLYCKPGSVLLQFEKPTRLLVAPDSGGS
jgi:hypothetical protein